MGDGEGVGSDRTGVAGTEARVPAAFGARRVGAAARGFLEAGGMGVGPVPGLRASVRCFT